MDRALRRRRLALFVFFFLPGVAMATWVTRTPAIRDGIGASIAEMGMVLFGVSVGSMSGILLASAVVIRLGIRATAVLGLAFTALSLLTLSLGVALSGAPLVALGLGFFGFGMGLAEIAINMDGAVVEKLSGRHLMHALHGAYSLGTLVGGLIGLALTALALPVTWHLVLVWALVTPPILWFGRYLPRDSGASADAAVVETSGSPLWTDRRLILIGLIIFAMALAEGAANDWLPLIMVDEYGFSQASGSLAFVVFAFAMTLGRFGGGSFLERFGRARVLRAGAILAALGVATVAFGHHPWATGIAVLLWGIGASLGFPVALSAAADCGPNSAARVRITAIIGYFSVLVGPPSLGFIGEELGLRSALMLVLALVVLAVLAAPAAGPRKLRPRQETECVPAT